MSVMVLNLMSVLGVSNADVAREQVMPTGSGAADDVGSADAEV